MGKSNHIIQKVEQWLDANIDDLFMNLDNKEKDQFIYKLEHYLTGQDQPDPLGSGRPYQGPSKK